MIAFIFLVGHTSIMKYYPLTGNIQFILFLIILLIHHFIMQPDKKTQNKQLKSFFNDDKQRYTFYFDLDPSKPSEKIDIYVEARTILEEVFIIAIENINQRLIKSGIQLDNDLILYKPRLTGKNFKPKTDMPALSLYQKICDLKINEVAVQVVNKEKAIRKLNNSEENKKQSHKEQQQLAKQAQRLQQLTISSKEQASETTHKDV